MPTPLSRLLSARRRSRHRRGHRPLRHRHYERDRIRNRQFAVQRSIIVCPAAQFLEDRDPGIIATDRLAMDDSGISPG